ncbi:MAG: hypothetical protein KDC98_06195 [Planctomycetes bacterium]|nr:hypothetical protein [Planctomycetota bacterium]
MSRHLPTTLATSMLLVGCHGGKSPTPAPPPTTLVVQTQQPAPGSTTDVDANVAVVFESEPDPTTLAKEALIVSDGSGPLSGTLRYDSKTRTWAWIADGQLPRGALIHVEIADSVRGALGVPLSGRYSWSFRVRAGAPLPPQSIANGITTDTGGGNRSVFTGLFPDGRSLIAAETWAWTLDAGGPGPAESVPDGRVRGLHLDATGTAAALTVGPASSLLPIHVSHRDSSGSWSPTEPIANTPNGSLVGTTLMGNEVGDLLLRTHTSLFAQGLEQSNLYWSAAAAPDHWRQLSTSQTLAWTWSEPPATIDGAGRVASMSLGSGFFPPLLVERHNPNTGANLTSIVAQGSFYQIESLTARDSGALHAIWHELGGTTWQRTATADGEFGPTSEVPVGVPARSNWLAAPTGTMVGWLGSKVVRFDAATGEWAEATLETEPLTAAISPRGEAIFLHLSSPTDPSLQLVRWRAGETIDPPLLIAAGLGPVTAARDAAVAVDAAGRVIVAFVPASPGELRGIRVE